jgi:hypothetical protein
MEYQFLQAVTGAEKQKTPLSDTNLQRAKIISRYHLFHLPTAEPGKGLTGHGHVPSAVTGGPVAPTPCRMDPAEGVQGAALGRNSLGGVAVSHLPTALLTRDFPTYWFPVNVNFLLL